MPAPVDGDARYQQERSAVRLCCTRQAYPLCCPPQLPGPASLVPLGPGSLSLASMTTASTTSHGTKGYPKFQHDNRSVEYKHTGGGSCLTGSISPSRMAVALGVCGSLETTSRRSKRFPSSRSSACALSGGPMATTPGAPHRRTIDHPQRGRRLRAKNLLGHLPYLMSKGRGENSMVGKRLNSKGCRAKCCKSCAHGEA